MAFCPKCGKKGIKSKFCNECAEKELGLAFKDIEIKKCIDCDRFMIRNAWKAFSSTQEGIVDAAKTKINNPKNIPLGIEPVHDKLKDKPGAEQEIELHITAEDQEFIIPAKIQFTYCDKCSKAGSQYYEGTLQLRNVTPELLQFVRDDIAKHAKEGVHVTKETGKGRNRDFQLTSTKYMRQLGKRLKARFNGELKESVKLFTRDKQTSKEVYRTNVLFRMRSYKVGDIVKTRGKKVKITSVGNNVTGTDVKTGKKVFVDEKELEKRM